MGRIAADYTPDGDVIYVPGIEHVYRIAVSGDSMLVDGAWRPRYRDAAAAEHGLAWDGCLSDGSLFIMDCGDVESLREIYAHHPNGRFPTPPGKRLSWRREAPWPGRLRLLRIDLESGEVSAIAPFEHAGGGIVAPPVNVPEHGVCIAWDSVNGGLAGISTGDELEVIWRVAARPSMQPVVFPESGELVINDYRPGDDQLIVVDVRTGEVRDRVSTGSRIANGMFLTPGGSQDLYYCSTFAVARVSWSDEAEPAS